MTTILKLIGWESRGLRCPDHKISFSKSSDAFHEVILLQMPNGTGKTTTLELLRATLSGIAEEAWDKEKITSFRKRISNYESGFFQLDMLFNSRRLTIKLELNFEDGTAQYYTTIPSVGMKQGFHPPRELQKFLKESFVNFFVFDGELAERLLDRKHTDAQTIIEDLFQINLISNIAGRIDDHWSEVAESKTAVEERGRSRRQNKVQELKVRLEYLKEEQAKLQKEFENTKRKLEKRKSKFEEELLQQREIRDRLQKAEGDYKESIAQVRSSGQSILNEMRNPHALSNKFAEEMVALKTSLDKVKLPESTAREFFEELAEEELCVCGRPLDNETKQLIRERASQYLGSDDVALLNTIKGDIATLIGHNPEEHDLSLQRLIENLIQECRTEMEFKTVRDQIQREGILNDPNLEKVKDEIDQLEKEVSNQNYQLSKYNDLDESKGHTSTFGIAIIEKRLRHAEKQLAEITQTLELKQKRDLLIKILNYAQQDALEGISKEICDEANERILELMPNNSIRVESINKSLKLQGQEGGSVGETLSVAYAFLATLFNRAEHQLPFIVDSPANPIDLRVRAKVAELVPKLTNQFIAFTISSERQSFVPALEKSAKNVILYITLFRKGATDLEDQAMKHQAQISSDGICVIGSNFFNEFHLDSEEVNNV